MKFSIVTPSYNSEKYIAATIESVISQAGNFDIEYSICDGASTDATISIIKKYERALSEKTYAVQCNSVSFRWSSEKDSGMYSAINRGFSQATGDYFAWINSDDIYLPGAFNAIATTFEAMPDVLWLKGISSLIDDQGALFRPGFCYIYNQDWIKKGIYGQHSYFIAQDAVFWRQSLWQKVGPLNSQLKLAGDYDLWIKMSTVTPLWSINFPVSCFRKRDGQLSKNIQAYKQEQQQVIPQTTFSNFPIRLFFSLQSRLDPYFQPFFLWLYRVLFLHRNKKYIDITNNIPEIKEAYSFISSISSATTS